MRKQDRAERVAALCDDFDRYLAVFDRSPPFQRFGQRELHERTIKLLRSAGGPVAAAASDVFIISLWETLRSWGIGVRASHLVEPPELGVRLGQVVPVLSKLSEFTLGSAPPETVDILWGLINDLGITANQALLVASTKTLHHLLPDLVPPIDRAYTGTFFVWHAPEFQHAQEQIFRTMWGSFQEIAQSVDLQRFVDDQPWHTSTTKVIDNAIIGYCIEHAISAVSHQRPARRGVRAPISEGPWSADELQALLHRFEAALRDAGLKNSSVDTYVNRAATFLRWLDGEYTPRGPAGSSAASSE